MINISELCAVAVEAGIAILEVYNSDDFEVELKSDNSPLTRADLASHDLIKQKLTLLYPDIPILSEEGKEIEFDKRKEWDKFWMIDPLDGTKEFIKRNGDFTVNIALIENKKPVLGVIHVPVTNETYFGDLENGSYKIEQGEKAKRINVSSKSDNEELIVVQSRSHSGEEESEFYSNYKIKERLSRGSSLKICMVAEGKAELYFRSGPTWEWDTAAGHAILEAAGGYIINKYKSTLVYNKQILKNFGFIVSSFEIN
ncbi:MAG: 3'(2'),5'-bisphosphate nucleotidase CysQ [Ignavibacteria bacterium]|nr:3'(2'),5'-bisphosphate nucleotidase CysQ [Ignavibacteria bacterium]